MEFTAKERRFADWLFRAGIRAAKREAKEDAHVLLTEGLVIDESFETGWLWLAEISSSQPSKAMALRKAVELNPSKRTRSKLASVLLRIGQAAASQGQKSVARSNFSDASKLEPSSAKVWLSCATVSQDAKQAISFLKKALALEPEHQKARAWLAKLEASAKRQAAKAPKKMVLLVDDSSTIQKLVKLTLTRRGYRVELASSGLQALSMLEDAEPNLILLDINMPEMDGLELLRRLKQNRQTRDIPVMMLTGSDGAADRNTGRQSGAVEYLVKPIKPAELEEAVARHVMTKQTSSHRPSV